MDPLNDLFSKSGWILAKNVDGKIKVASENSNELRNSDKSEEKWITLENIQLNQSDEYGSSPLKSERKITLHKENKSDEYITGYFFIRDLLNFQKANVMSNSFMAYGQLVQKIVLCARITSVEQKDNYSRLILDDGTSAILCLIKGIPHSVDDTINISEPLENNDATSTDLLNQMDLHGQRITQETSTKFDVSDLGQPVMIIGRLREFQGKNFIFAESVCRITENSLVHALEYVAMSYRSLISRISCGIWGHATEAIRVFCLQRNPNSSRNAV